MARPPPGADIYRSAKDLTEKIGAFISAKDLTEKIGAFIDGWNDRFKAVLPKKQVAAGQVYGRGK